VGLRDPELAGRRLLELDHIRRPGPGVERSMGPELGQCTAVVEVEEPHC
jgi:hypothetical protein